MHGDFISILHFIPVQLDFWFPDSALQIISKRVVDFQVSADKSTAVQILMQENEIQFE